MARQECSVAALGDEVMAMVRARGWRVPYAASIVVGQSHGRCCRITRQQVLSHLGQRPRRKTGSRPETAERAAQRELLTLRDHNVAQTLAARRMRERLAELRRGNNLEIPD